MSNPTKLDEIQDRADASPGCDEPDCLADNCVVRRDRVRLVAALRAVEKVHWRAWHPVKTSTCNADGNRWPCPTITAIREALG